MCGIYAAATVRGRRLGVTVPQAITLRDQLAHRGPDGAGLWESENVILAHRRLAVIDPSDAGAQPMAWPYGTSARDARWVISYNGELYNDAVLRKELACEGVAFRTHCDTETVLAALATWGVDAIPKFRGMFALVALDVANHRLVIARDPLGIKPIYWGRGGDGTIYVASEPGPIVRSPGMRAAPNWRMVSAYVSTIRTTLSGETMFEGVRQVRPGTIVEVDLSGARAEIIERTWWRGGLEDAGSAVGPSEVRDAIEESVSLHLRSDVPTCCLLSGGLDSTILAGIAARSMEGLRTYAAGPPVEDDEDPSNSDLVFGARVAKDLATTHAEAVVTRTDFLEQWSWMVGALGVPLSAPNEVAIYRIASRLRADGCIVTLSGEGADELFGGYDQPLARVAAMRAPAEREFGSVSPEGAGVMELVSAAWAPPGVKDRVVRPEFWRAVHQDQWMLGAYADAMAESMEEAGTTGLGAHLRMHRRINLSGLLQRLDTSTMLASVEGRTPFADVAIAELGERLPMSAKIVLGEDAGDMRSGAAGGAAISAKARTKIVLREAFAASVPGYVMDRAKRSFPVPFRRWVGGAMGAASASEIVREVYRADVIAQVVANPETMWHIAWPMANLAMWGERWWGKGAA